MKKSLLALAVLGTFAGAASAQSSVTLFGLLDQSVNYEKSNGQRLVTLDSSMLSSNRIGFRGTEDLGSGLQAGFWLEAGMGVDTGTAGGGNGLATTPTGTSNLAPASFFNRRSTVSLLGNWGEVRLGRDYTPTFSNQANYDVFGANGIGEGVNLNIYSFRTAGTTLGSGSSQAVRANNSVAYWLPTNSAGVYGRVQVSASEGAATGKYYGGQLAWAGFGADVGAAYGKTKFQTGPDFNVYNVGGAYDFGVAKIYAVYNVAKFDPVQLKTGELSVGIPFGVSVVNASFTYGKFSGAPATSVFVGKAQQYALQYIYNLSKRTSLYGTVSHVANKDGASFNMGGSLNTTANQKMDGANVGIRHVF